MICSCVKLNDRFLFMECRIYYEIPQWVFPLIQALFVCIHMRFFVVGTE